MAAGGLMEFGGVKFAPEVRMLSDLRRLLYDKVWASTAADAPLYYMYRDLARNGKDRSMIADKYLRYDITVIPPRMLGLEYVKTAGHYHTNPPGQKISYPELYAVLEGKAHYLLQKSVGETIVDVILVEAEKGDFVLIPPGYGHVTINPSNSDLRMANWVCSSFKSDYKAYLEKEGASYYEVEGRRFVQNSNYAHIPSIRIFGPTNLGEFGVKKGKDPYSLVESLDALEYLTNPGKHVSLFELFFKD